MTDKAALLFAKVSETNAQIEGMKADNAYRISIGCEPQIQGSDFSVVAAEIRKAIEEFQKPELRVMDGEPPKELLGNCEACGSEVFEGDGHSSDPESGYLCPKCFGDEKRREESFRKFSKDCNAAFICDPFLDGNCNADCCPVLTETSKS